MEAYSARKLKISIRTSVITSVAVLNGYAYFLCLNTMVRKDDAARANPYAKQTKQFRLTNLERRSGQRTSAYLLIPFES